MSISGELDTRAAAGARAALRAAIAAALEPTGAAKEKVAMFTHISRRNGEMLAVQAVPLPKRHRPAPVTSVSHKVAACALVIHGSTFATPAIGTQLLKEVYGLTPAEVRVALAIADGETINRYADRRGISRNTAVSQLKRAFAKTGVRRQSELVRWLFLCGTTPRGSAQRR